MTFIATKNSVLARNIFLFRRKNDVPLERRGGGSRLQLSGLARAARGGRVALLGCGPRGAAAESPRAAGNRGMVLGNQWIATPRG